MIRELVTLPVKLPLAVARLGVQLATEVAKEVLGLKPELGTPPPRQQPTEPARRPRWVRPEPEPAETGAERVVAEGVTLREEPDIEAGPHPEVDELFDRDPTASDATEHRRELHEAEFGSGGGAELRVSEPWDGYDEMTAPQIVARLRTADAAVLAIVRIYEGNHRARKTVLRAADETVAGRAGTNGT